MGQILSNDRSMHGQLRQVQMRCNRLAAGTKGIFARINSIGIAILFSCLLASPAWGQNTGALSGTVEDPAGEDEVGADVRLRHQITVQYFSTSPQHDSH